MKKSKSFDLDFLACATNLDALPKSQFFFIYKVFQHFFVRYMGFESPYFRNIKNSSCDQKRCHLQDDCTIKNQKMCRFIIGYRLKIVFIL